MREAFKGWRRKLGIPLLALACGISSAWIRSMSFQDTFALSTGPHSEVRFISASQYLIVASIAFQPPAPPPASNSFSSTSDRISFDGWLFTAPENIQIYFGFHGYSFARNTQVVSFGPAQLSVTALHFPYWSVALPLTLLSVRLLLGWSPKKVARHRPPAPAPDSPAIQD